MIDKTFARMGIAAVALWILLQGLSNPSVAVAAPIGPCLPNTPIPTLNASGGCIAGDKLFSNFLYINSGLQISHLVFVTPANILVTAVPDKVAFSTDYGLRGAFINCCAPEEEGALGWDVTVNGGGARLSGLALIGATGASNGGQGITEIACLGPGNPASVSQGGFSGYRDVDVSRICPRDPAHAAGLDVTVGFGPSRTPTFATFPPASAISVSMTLFVDAGGTVPPVGTLISEVPFPGTLLLVLAGLAMLARPLHHFAA